MRSPRRLLLKCDCFPPLSAAPFLPLRRKLPTSELTARRSLVGQGGLLIMSNTRPWIGSIGLIIGAYWSRLEIFHSSNWKRRVISSRRLRPLWLESTNRVSGITGRFSTLGPQFPRGGRPRGSCLCLLTATQGEIHEYRHQTTRSFSRHCAGDVRRHVDCQTTRVTWSHLVRLRQQCSHWMNWRPLNTSSWESRQSAYTGGGLSGVRPRHNILQPGIPGQPHVHKPGDLGFR